MLRRKVHHDGNGRWKVFRQSAQNDGQGFQTAHRGRHCDDAMGWFAMKITHRQYRGWDSPLLVMAILHFGAAGCGIGVAATEDRTGCGCAPWQSHNKSPTAIDLFRRWVSTIGTATR